MTTLRSAGRKAPSQAGLQTATRAHVRLRHQTLQSGTQGTSDAQRRGTTARQHRFCRAPHGERDEGKMRGIEGGLDRSEAKPGGIGTLRDVAGSCQRRACKHDRKNDARTRLRRKALAVPPCRNVRSMHRRLPFSGDMADMFVRCCSCSRSRRHDLAGVLAGPRDHRPPCAVEWRKGLLRDRRLRYT